MAHSTKIQATKDLTLKPTLRIPSWRMEVTQRKLPRTHVMVINRRGGLVIRTRS